MTISTRKGELQTEEADVLIVNLFEGVTQPGGATGAINKALDGDLMRVAEEERFTGEKGKLLLVRTQGQLPARRVLLVGLGKKESFNAEVIRDVTATSYKHARTLRAKHVISVLHGAGSGDLSPRVAASAMTEGVRLAEYQFLTYKKKEDDVPPEIGSFEIVTRDGRDVRSASRGVKEGEFYASGANLARDLVNTPAQDMRPVDLMHRAKAIAKGDDRMQVKVFDQTQLEKMGAGGILSVAKGSEHEPYMVHMTFKPKAKKAKKRIMLVGKAVTFDSGGLSLKPAQGMTTMKMDMGGSAVVLGVMSALRELNPAVEVHGIFGAVENMPAGNAMRPGDVIRAINKKTIEVLNTDAEGRLTLADTLSYASEKKPDMIIDLATLTGACVVALGEEVTAVMTNNDALKTRIMDASEESGEPMWELPLRQEYNKLLKSEIADLKNIGGQYGGAITAGLFLQHFVDDTIPWAHLDIAGPTYAERPMTGYYTAGATGHGVRTLLRLIQSI